MPRKAYELVVLFNVFIILAAFPLQSQYAVQIGENFSIPGCNMSKESLFSSLTFRRDGSSHPRIVAYTNEQKLFIKNIHQDRVISLQLSGLLMLHNVSLEDQGLYKCNMVFEYSNEIRREIQLYVGASPVIEPFLQPSISLLEGHQLKIICQVSGVPSPDVFWYRKFVNSNQGIKIGRGNTLEIRDILPSNSGQYHCYASNFIGDAKRTLRIQVHEKPKVREFFHTSALHNTIYECEDLEFSCQAWPSVPPVLAYHLFHNRHPLINGSKTGRFTIREVRKKDQGLYSCLPENKHGMGWNSSIEIKVHAAPNNCKKNFSTSTNKIDPEFTTTAFVTGHVPSSSWNLKGNAPSNTGNQLHKGYFMTAVLSVLVKF